MHPCIAVLFTTAKNETKVATDKWMKRWIYTHNACYSAITKKKQKHKVTKKKKTQTNNLLFLFQQYGLRGNCAYRNKSEISLTKDKYLMISHVWYTEKTDELK